MIVAEGNSIRPCSLTGSWLQRALDDLVGFDFSVWAYEGRWTPLTAEPGSDFAENADGDVLAALDAAQDSLEPATVRPGRQGARLVIAVPGEHAGDLWVTANVAGHELESLRPLARLCRKHLEHSARLEQIQADAAAYVETLASNFESLSFLRGVADSFVWDGSDDQKWQSVQKTLLELVVLIRAESLIALAPATESPTARSHAIPVAWAGSKVADPTLFALLSHCGPPDGVQTVVRNQVLPAAEGGFMLVPIRHKQRLFGWLLAVNKLDSADSSEMTPAEFGTIEAGLLETFAAIIGSYLQIVEQSRLQQLVLDSAADGICGTDAKGVITFANPAAAASLQLPAEQLLGQRFHDVCRLVQPDGTSCAWEQSPLAQVLQSGTDYQSGHVLVRRLDGSKFPVAIGIRPMREGSKHLRQRGDAAQPHRARAAGTGGP